MFRSIAVIALIAVIAAAIPGGAETARADKTRQVRIAMLAPRGSTLSGDFKKLNKALRRATDNSVRLRIYPSGVAGDENDVIDKMRQGQMESAILTATGLGRIVPEITVLDAPGLITTYQQLDAVQDQLQQSWEKKLYNKGYTTLGWGECGQYRIFSKKPIKEPSDIKTLRPWVWPLSQAMKALWQSVGVKANPLASPVVYAELQLNSIDTVVASALALRAMQWDAKLDHVNAEPFGILTGAFILKRSAWEALPDNARELIKSSVASSEIGNKSTMRKADQTAYRKLIERNYTATDWTPGGGRQWDTILKDVRKQLAGKAYPAALLARVSAIAARAK